MGSLRQAPRPRDSNPSGLGRAIINRKVKDARKTHKSGLVGKMFSPCQFFLTFTF